MQGRTNAVSRASLGSYCSSSCIKPSGAAHKAAGTVLAGRQQRPTLQALSESQTGLSAGQAQASLQLLGLQSACREGGSSRWAARRELAPW